MLWICNSTTRTLNGECGVCILVFKNLSAHVYLYFSQPQPYPQQLSMPLSFETDELYMAGRAVNALAMNQYIVGCKATREAAMVDCGDVPDVFLHWARQRE